MPFDPKAPFGRICPPTNGCVYYQNGKNFDTEFNERDFDTGKIIAKAPKVEKKPEMEMPKPKGEPFKGLSMASMSDAQKVEELDLEGWSEGTVKAPFFRVRAHVTKKFGVTPTTAEEARAIIKGE